MVRTQRPLPPSVVENPGLAAYEPMGVHTLGDQGLRHFPMLVGNLGRDGGGIGPGGRASTFLSWWLGVFRFGDHPRSAATLTWLPATGPHVSASH